MAVKDYTGIHFSFLTIIKHVPNHKNRRFVLIKCDCGAIKELRLSHVVCGKIKSCGCKRPFLVGEIKRSHGKSRTIEYETWSRMIGRCTNPLDSSYHTHGGRGIKVCDRWRNSFDNFFYDMGKRPAGKSLDRYPNNNGDYCPNNCRWATPKEQSRNTRRTIIVTINGTTKPLIEWCEQLALNPKIVRQRIRKLGWSAERALGF